VINIIAAVSLNGVIGNNGGIPWHSREDLKRFKKLTTGCPVIMGRKTYESVGEPLPDRDSIVISKELNDDRVIVARSFEDALVKSAMFTGPKWVIGGSSVYREALPLADNMYLTHVLSTHGGDTMFPAIDWTEWQMDLTENGWDLMPAVTFANYRRRNNE